ncbi:glucosamine-6-phosphate deaminase [Rhizobium laguerreae]|uniref:glucosamine-6-phosphate deaminase n=1 Tax=Rhizobium TaxID=379 RepID=UPI00036BFAAC|nr:MULTISPECIES: glucosamine-6-phosphate deaminase [Rhizobium]MBY5368643.1 glucosamine-6-phosphate deaminase [Rhizobium leguminosarum]MBY5451637.1 glucosamine-6-phosphate deaminase [Rhizobium leguminosarum]NNG73750.1 glucosamine-6-phosphate deaminase [Rhizobium laguerreae]
MEIIVKDTVDEASAIVAEILLRQVEEKPDCALGLPTGATPLGVYARLIEDFRNGCGCYNRAHAFNLDEYLGIPGTDTASYAFYMRENLFRHIDFMQRNIHIPDGSAADASAEATRYETQIAARGGIDLMFLGLGRNAHIGFNEPGSPHDTRTRRVALTASTMEANARYFAPGSRQPTHAITMGIGTILESRRIVVLATGIEKASAVAASLAGPMTDAVPGSALARHAHTTIVLDRDAAHELDRILALEIDA